jgi:hypothetical protein
MADILNFAKAEPLDDLKINWPSLPAGVQLLTLKELAYYLSATERMAAACGIPTWPLGARGEDRRYRMDDVQLFIESTTPVKDVEFAYKRLIREGVLTDLPTKTSLSKTYFILSKKLAAVKIGRSANPKKRLKDLSTANPDRLVLLGVLEGDREDEFHGRFNEYRINPKLEWFSMGPFLMEFLKAEFNWIYG